MVKRYFSLFVLITGIIIIIDQLFKFIIRRNITEPITITGFFSISNIQNTGAGFGLFQGQRVLLIIISLVIIFLIIIYYNKIEQKRIPQVGWSLILGGAIGNVIDRLVFGSVTDFLNFSFWPAFNVADMAVSVGVIGLILYYWKN